MITAEKLLKNHSQKLKFVMYECGAGGEKLCYEISRWSPQMIPKNGVREVGNNRWYIPNEEYNGAFTADDKLRSIAFKDVDHLCEYFKLSKKMINVDEGALADRHWTVRGHTFKSGIRSMLPESMFHYIVFGDTDEFRYARSLMLMKHMLRKIGSYQTVVSNLEGYLGVTEGRALYEEHKRFFHDIVDLGGSFMFIFDLISYDRCPESMGIGNILECEPAYLCSNEFAAEWVYRDFIPKNMRGFRPGVLSPSPGDRDGMSFQGKANMRTILLSHMLDASMVENTFGIDLDRAEFNASMDKWHRDNLEVIRRMHDMGITLP